MFHKLHKLCSHLGAFKANMGVYIKEHEEQLYKDVMDFERRYEGKHNRNMIGAYYETILVIFLNQFLVILYAIAYHKY